MAGMSRVNREVYARFCERLGVKSPGPTYLAVRLRGEPHRLWRAVDEHGTELDVLLQSRCVAYAGISFPFRSSPVVLRLAATLDAGP
ncbi:hypothetical protein LMG29542_08286 [Paraburkholderia humisilvae]|uniref:Uncharacterized protein n=1 Tax=Paraburkholderia humisilvae TaxID=627669 RepID=A0A6J5F8T0_9BURK|nr:hypothetical protein LMG29542_08286 [Paraburkholderia humisilvae]